MEYYGEQVSPLRRVLDVLQLQGVRLGTAVFIANAALLVVTVLAVSLTQLISSADGRREQTRTTAEQTASQIAEVIADVGEISIANVARAADGALDPPMTAQAWSAAHLVRAAETAGYGSDRIVDVLTAVVEQTVLDEFWITDTTGFSYLTNARDPDGNLIPFGFSPSPTEQPQAFVFYPLLGVATDSFDVVTQPAQVREVDNAVFKYVGTNGIDHARVVQVGNKVEFSDEELLDQTHATATADVAAAIEGNLASNIRVVGLILDFFVQAALDAGWSADRIEADLRSVIDRTIISEILVSDLEGNVTYQASASEGERLSQLRLTEELENLVSAEWVNHETTAVDERNDASYKFVTVARNGSDRFVQVGVSLVSGESGGNILYLVYQEQANVLVQTGYPEALWFVTAAADSIGIIAAAAQHSAAGDPEESARAWSEDFTARSDTTAGLLQAAIATRSTHSYARLGLFDESERGIWVATPVAVEGSSPIGTLMLFINLDQTAEEIWGEVRQTAIVALLLLLLTAAASFVGARRLTQPIEKIAEAAREVEAGEQPNYEVMAPVAARADEIGALARVFQDMTVQVFNREEVLESLVSERTAELVSANQELREAQQAINRDLEMAKVVQAALIREGTLEVDNCSACARMEPAQAVGGDFVDFQYWEQSRKLFIALGDVSGKGVAAALFMAASQGAIKFAAADHGEAAMIAQEANNRLCSQNPMALFVTCFIAVVELDTGKVTYVSAGHESPYILTSDTASEDAANGNGTRTSLEGTRGVAMGVMEGFQYQSREITLEPGQSLVIYSDGLTDMINLAGDIYGRERLEASLDAVTGQSPLAIVDYMWEDIATFSQGTAAADDRTCLVVRRNRSQSQKA